MEENLKVLPEARIVEGRYFYVTQAVQQIEEWGQPSIAAVDRSRKKHAEVKG
ncbi:hypothetical protein [Candidatus Synechococcus spongiarum]|uniref:hypothetical protein n=1 Tax=Candidatus Synechococcus spongiarum TaxID=431041 RepID=UPI000A64F676|nr:hypothetical protein [Candidatus Synechococcus spongiarum]